MTKPAHKVAILHRDGEIVARVTRLATLAGLDIVRPASYEALARHIDDPLLSAIVIELPAPRDGGVETLEHLHSPSSHAAIVVMTDVDHKTAENARRVVAANGLNVAIFQKIDDAELMRQLCGGRDRVPNFGHAEIDDCIENRNFRVEYQPKVSLLSTSASQFGVEALCRMHDPKFGTISPDKFIPMAEKSGLIAKLTDAVVCEAFRAWRSWKASGLCLRLALNVSPVLLGDAEWSERFLQRCAEFGMEPKWVTLEITETAAGATSPKACEILTHLHQKGFALSIDDFGTGFSSLASLYRLPIAEMKIDKSFILDLQGTAGARSLVESAIAMAKRMDIKVVAEGVESESVFEELRKMGCHEVQGFFVGKSMPAEAVVPFFTSWKRNMVDAPSASDRPRGLPKIVILQALLNEIVNDRSLDTSPAPAGPYGSQAQTAEAKEHPNALVRKIPPLVLEGKTIPALALCHAAMRQLQNLHGCADMRAKVSQLQSHLEGEIASNANLEIYSPQRVFRFLPSNMATLGRPSVASRVDIPIKCRWFSSGEKNLRLFTKSGQWFLEDLGSTHGHYIDGTKLRARHPIELPLGKTQVEVRLASGAVAPLSLLIRRTSLNPDAVAISFDYDLESLRANLGEKDWSELERDLACTWIMFNGKIEAGSSLNCALVLDDCAWSMAATIRYDNGYWISPAADRTIAIDDTIFHQNVPLAVKSVLNLGGSHLVVRETAGEDAGRVLSKAGQTHAFEYKAREA